VAMTNPPSWRVGELVNWRVQLTKSPTHQVTNSHRSTTAVFCFGFGERRLDAACRLAIAVGVAAGQRNASGSHHLYQPVGPQHLDEAVDLVLGSRRFDDQRLGAHVDDPRAIHLDEL